jgi:predicted DNA binding CopG/RHH family protein
MPKLDKDELEILKAYDEGKLKSVATMSELNRIKAAALATAIKGRRVNIRSSAGDLHDIQTENGS